MTHAVSRIDKKVELIENKEKDKAKEYIHSHSSSYLDTVLNLIFID